MVCRLVTAGAAILQFAEGQLGVGITIIPALSLQQCKHEQSPVGHQDVANKVQTPVQSRLYPENPAVIVFRNGCGPSLTKETTAQPRHLEGCVAEHSMQATHCELSPAAHAWLLAFAN